MAITGPLDRWPRALDAGEMKRWKFFRENGELRPRMINPPLILVNGRKKKSMPKRKRIIHMKRDSSTGMFLPTSNPRHKKHHKRNWYGAGAVVPMNPRKHKKRHAAS